MAKPRVYELAKVLNVDSKTVLEKLKDMGEFVKSASSTIEPPVARRLKAEFAKDNAKGDSKPVQQRRPAAPSAPASTSSSAPTPAAPARQASPASAHQQAPTPGAPTPRPQGGARPGMPTPAATVRTTTVRMVAIIAKAVRAVVRVARTIAVTTIVVTTRAVRTMASRFSIRTTAAMLRLRARTLRAAPVPMAAMPLQMRFRARTLRARARATTRSPASRVCTPRRRVIFRVRIRWLVRLLITVVAVVRAVPAKARAGPRLPWRSSGPRWSGRSASRPVGPQPSGSGRRLPGCRSGRRTRRLPWGPRRRQ